MDTVYHVTPLMGLYSEPFIFLTDNLSDSNRFKCDPSARMWSTLNMAMAEGFWHMNNDMYGFEVVVTPQTDDGSGEDMPMLLITGYPFLPGPFHLTPLEIESEDSAVPDGALKWMTPADVVYLYAASYYLDHSSQWEEEDYSPDEIIRALDEAMQSQDSPWFGELFLRSNREIGVPDPDGVKVSVPSARRWQFRDRQRSLLYLTPEGPMFEEAFQQKAFGSLTAAGVPFASEDPVMALRH